MPLDPQIAELLIQRQASGIRQPSELSPTDARAQLSSTVQQRLAFVSTAACQIDDIVCDPGNGSVPLRRYTPPSAISGSIVYYHGGGWVLGGLDDSDQLCLALALNTSRQVYSVGYRLAPEHPFPAAVDDAFTALVEVAERTPYPGKIVVVGDSAGGNLAAVTALRARDADGPTLALQVLLYPITDHDLERTSYRMSGGLGYILTTDDIRWFWQHYLPDATQRSHPTASPLRADLRGLPPALVIVAGYDPLRDEGIAYAERLQAAGVHVALKEYPGAIHGFLGMLGVADVASDAITVIAEAIGDATCPQRACSRGCEGTPSTPRQ